MRTEYTLRYACISTLSLPSWTNESEPLTMGCAVLPFLAGQGPEFLGKTRTEHEIHRTENDRFLTLRHAYVRRYKCFLSTAFVDLFSGGNCHGLAAGFEKLNCWIIFMLEECFYDEEITILQSTRKFHLTLFMNYLRVIRLRTKLFDNIFTNEQME